MILMIILIGLCCKIKLRIIYFARENQQLIIDKHLKQYLCKLFDSLEGIEHVHISFSSLTDF